LQQRAVFLERKPVWRASMDQDDYQFLRYIAAECRERAGRAQDDKDRTLWLELAEEIASRDPAWSKAISAKPN
jgi:hypothetical protein